MANFEKGLNRAIKSSWSGDDSSTANGELTGLYTGIVMDDADDQRMGQIWVYIPGISQRRQRKTQAYPSYGGTAPDRNNPGGNIRWDQDLRLGWIQCAPMLPFFGGDDYRVSKSPGGDYRNAGNGDVTTYGFWAQPRIGDQVGILFANGDAATAYWIGCIPKYARNFMVPGNPGRPPADLDAKIDEADEDNPNPALHKLTQQFKIEAPSDSLVPVVDKARRESNNKNQPIERELIDVLVAPEAALNVQKSGLLCDPLRGAGTSSSRRESPSYVYGFKSAGWNFDSEKGNLNTAGGERTQFGGTGTSSRDNPYQDINTMGHQLTFDDHPDHQGIRLRTSAGSQLYFSDACASPYIYITTAQGNVWVEMVDNGKINIFTEDSVSIHSRNDINLTADRDINIDAQRDLNLQVRRNTNLKFKGENQFEFGKNDLPPKDLKYDLDPNWGKNTSGSDSFDTTIQSFGNMNLIVGNTDGEYPLDIGGNASVPNQERDFCLNVSQSVDWTIGSNLHMDIGHGSFASPGSLDIKVGSTTRIETDVDTNIKTGGVMNSESGGLMSLKSGANIQMTASPDIHLNSAGNPASSAANAQDTETCNDPVLATTVETFRVPTFQEVKDCVEPPAEFRTLDRMTVPQHQAWPGRTECSTGTRGFVDEAPSDVSRSGSTTLDAKKPVNLPEETRYREGQDFTTNNTEEAATYVDATPRGEFADCSTYTTSERGLALLKQQEGTRTKAYTDADGYAIGVGHFIKVGDVINGDTINGRVTQSDIDNLRRTKGDLNISDAEIDRILKKDLVKFEQAVCNQVSTKITQGQFDAMVNYTFNGGEGALRRMVQRSNMNTGDFSKVPQAWMRLSTCSRCPTATRARTERVLRKRRRLEMETLFTQA